MHERFVDIDTPSGRMETFVTHPEGDGSFPAVIIYMDVWGVREELFEIARRVGTVGYYCMVPDFLPNRDIFHPRAAARDWEMIFAMFRRQLPSDAV
jgi:carboxymethylenebutenolidase